ncbi:hypothetical protein PF005_g24624 [Phytophthora fragariae]|uniref:Fe2OG dioxygenase domain-containing protein n=1 Tax=Phytophthora fragariae TaxID=53985 RepID=A0A6A3RNT9_9STRA|nr:hypothetical protein PF003_g20578 [Phytophthora fragariae]KAE8926756.1 hypothetical protein PF009_g23061 [Phytophthora fragariae]KAE8977525.1 hypothetical protein PF011_g23615 [Phytophthora fragariae]KAE9082815.1 hypothetical protein PF010_g21441 [Phytophthora fragariae]KAE9095649.1 hypothetical protein PF006_g23960 [Phytophthora fragariae]
MGWGWRRRYDDYEDDVDREEPDDSEVFCEGKWPFGGEGLPTDTPTPLGNGCQQINEMLARADNNAGEYSFGGQATTLPAFPGLHVDGLGLIPVPLTEEHATKLIAKCDKSPFGKKLDTMMDENVRKSWQMGPDQVEIKNPLWHDGLVRLTETIADRLGYKGVPMQCLLYKLLVYGEGGHFVKHQDTEKEDGMVATLVMQLPSVHEGGDLVVYRRGEGTYRHDFGKKDGTAAYLPQFAVHYADAEHSLEQVTSGYRLVLVYSVCLPPTMRHLMRNHDQTLSEELAGVVNGMGQEDESFALLLSHEYTEKSVGELGSRALKGIDRARVQALEEANAVVSPAKRLQFFIAELEHDVSYYDDGGTWEENERAERINWYSTKGESISRSLRTKLKLNFLNPGLETFSGLWASRGNSTFEGYLGNSGATRNTTYSRDAVVAWPAAQGVKNAFKYINVNAAVGALQAQRPVDADSLRRFMEVVCVKLSETPQDSNPWDHPKTVSVGFCRSMCELLVDAGDPALVRLFFCYFVNGLNQYEKKDDLVDGFTALAGRFDWNDIGQALLSFLDRTVESTGMSLFEPVHMASGANNSGLRMALRIADGLYAGAAQQALIRIAAEKAARLREEDLCKSSAIGLLWKWAIRCDDVDIFNIVANKFCNMKPTLLQPVIEAFSQHVGVIDASDNKFAVLASIAAKRIDWLNGQLQSMGQPFSWEMPDAHFPDNAQIQAFLRGPNVSMDIIGVRHFNGIGHARNYAAKWMREKQVNASFTLEPEGRGQNAFVVITKTRSWFSENQRKLVEYTAEVKHLQDRYGAETTGNARSEHAWISPISFLHLSPTYTKNTLFPTLRNVSSVVDWLLDVEVAKRQH